MKWKMPNHSKLNLIKAFESIWTQRIVHIRAGQNFLIASQTSSHQYVPVKLHVLRQHIWHKTPSPLVPAIIVLKSLRKPHKGREHTKILLMIQQQNIIQVVNQYYILVQSSFGSKHNSKRMGYRLDQPLMRCHKRSVSKIYRPAYILWGR